MTLITPSNPDLLTDLDVEHSYFRCCGDEDLVFLRCPGCGHVMVFCYECDTLFPDLTEVTTRRDLARGSEVDRVVCPACGDAFEDAEPVMGKPTRAADRGSRTGPTRTGTRAPPPRAAS